MGRRGVGGQRVAGVCLALPRLLGLTLEDLLLLPLQSCLEQFVLLLFLVLLAKGFALVVVAADTERIAEALHFLLLEEVRAVRLRALRQHLRLQLSLHGLLQLLPLPLLALFNLLLRQPRKKNQQT
jgi:hypothetical protein